MKRSFFRTRRGVLATAASLLAAVALTGLPAGAARAP